MIILLTVVLVVLLLGYFLLKINFDELLGIASGATGNPAILAYGNSLAPTGTPDINYAMIFPGVGTIVNWLPHTGSRRISRGGARMRVAGFSAKNYERRLLDELNAGFGQMMA
jgi:hypothetical protein